MDSCFSKLPTDILNLKPSRQWSRRWTISKTTWIIVGWVIEKINEASLSRTVVWHMGGNRTRTRTTITTKAKTTIMIVTAVSLSLNAVEFHSTIKTIMKVTSKDLLFTTILLYLLKLRFGVVVASQQKTGSFLRTSVLLVGKMISPKLKFCSNFMFCNNFFGLKNLKQPRFESEWCYNLRMSCTIHEVKLAE